MVKFKVSFIVILSICFSASFFSGALSQTAQPNVENQAENLISLDVKNMNLVDVLRLIADQGGLNIVTSKNVRGTITIKITDVPIEDALKTILDVNSCKYVKESNIIKVYTYQDLQQEERFKELKTKIYSLEFAKASDLKPLLLAIKSARGKIEVNAKANQIIIFDIPDVIEQIESMIKELDKEVPLKIFELNYADPAEIQTKLTQLIPKTEGEIIVDARTNSIIVKASSPVQKEIEVLIKKWDRQSKQVRIEAKIVEVTLDDSLKLGINWNYVMPAAVSKGKPSTADLSGDFNVGLTDGGIFKVGTLSADDYTATFEMLATQANTDVLSSPRITVLDGQKASILVGSSEPYMITSEDPVTGFITESTNFIDVGVKLIVTPKISQDNHVTMEIHPEVSTARRVAEADNALAIDKSEADTTLTVKSGETVILGGLMRQAKKKTVKKIPLLGDIPLLGLLFRNLNEENVKKELIVFITPFVVNSEGKIIKNDEERRIEKLINETIYGLKRKRENKKETSFEQE